MSDRPPVGGVRFGDFDRIEPIGAYFSRGRGTSVDRFYIARYLDQHSADVKGRVLEIEENRYASQFGGDRVTRVDVLDIWPEESACDHHRRSRFVRDAATRQLRLHRLRPNAAIHL